MNTFSELNSPDLLGVPNVLRTLLIIIVIFYAFRFIMRLVGPWILKKGVEKMQRKAEEQMRQQQGRASTDRPEGTITIDKDPRGKGKDSEDDGDYVDFEEII
ncbi:MAG: DUF4834 family protein [Flavobacteriales bacterium]|nr:DUF4834 family protein [Flavobacteriales bacterium]